MNPELPSPFETPQQEFVPAVEETRPFWGWDDVLLFAGGVLPAILLATLLQKGGLIVLPAFFKSRLVQMLTVQSLFYILLMTVLWLIISVRHGRPFWSALDWRFPFQGVFFAFTLGPMIALSVGVLGVAFKAPRITMPFEDAVTGTASIILMGLFVAILGPVFEELVFRGFLLPLLERSIGLWPAIIAAAAPFALMHGPQYHWSWQHLLLVGYAGVVFGWMKVSRGSTAAAAITHGTYNLFFYSAFLAQQTRPPV
jgi:membrane protease YdiL (CAAX protease family)